MSNATKLDTTLRNLVRDMEALVESVLSAVEVGALSHVASRRTLNALSYARRTVLEEANASSKPVNSHLHDPFELWPNRTNPCPKCANELPQWIAWMEGKEDQTEHIKHTCRCGYTEFTLTAEESARLWPDDTPRRIDTIDTGLPASAKDISTSRSGLT